MGRAGSWPGKSHGVVLAVWLIVQRSALTPFGGTLVLTGVGDGVPLVQQLNRSPVEALTACRRPAVTGIGDVVEKQSKIVLVVPSRRHSERLPRTPSSEVVEERLHFRGLPLPGVLVREPSEPLDQGDPGANGRLPVEESRALLTGPSFQHCVEDGGLGVQVHDPVGEDQMRGPWQINDSTHVAFHATTLGWLRGPGQSVSGIDELKLASLFTTCHYRP